MPLDTITKIMYVYLKLLFIFNLDFLNLELYVYSTLSNFTDYANFLAYLITSEYIDILEKFIVYMLIEYPLYFIYNFVL